MLGSIAAVMGIVGGINSLSGGGVTKALGGGGGGSGVSSDAQKAADPFSQYRPQLATQYADALKTGASTNITKMPGYSQFKTGVMDPSLEATKRSMAASGQMQSGNEQIALLNKSQQGYYGFMQDYMNRLATGSGASQSPLGGATFGANIQSGQDQAMMQGLGGVMQGAAGLYRGSGTASSSTASSSYGMPSWGSTGGTTTAGGSADAAALFGSDGYGYSSSYDPSAGWSI